MVTVTLQERDGQVGITLPAAVLARMGFTAGQDLTLVEMPDGVKLMRPPAPGRQMQLAQDVLLEQSDALRELAKR